MGSGAILWSNPIFVSSDETSALDSPASVQEKLDGERIKVMLSFENSRRKRLYIVAILHGNRFLKDDWAAIKLRIDQVDGRTGPPDAMFPCLILRVRSRKRREQGWVDIHDSVRKFAQKCLREHTHETREAHETDTSILQRARKGAVIILAGWERGFVCVIENECVDAGLPRPVEASRFRTIGDHDGNFCIQLPRRNCVDDGLQVGTTA